MVTTMAKFRYPRVGDLVTVTTRYKSNLLDKEWDINTYRNVPVTRVNEFPNSFTVRAEIEYPGFTMHESVISISHVIELKIHNKGKLEENIHIPQEQLRETVIVPGSVESKYTVVLENGTPVSCTCPGFYYRQMCKHLGMAKRIHSGEDPKTVIASMTIPKKKKVQPHKSSGKRIIFRL